MFVLDSSALIELINGGPKATQVQALMGDAPLATTSISMHEVLIGARSEKERFVFEGMFSAMSVLAHDARAALAGSRIDAQLSHQGTKINFADVLIAGTCAAHHAELVTLDGDFGKIKNVKVHIL